MGTKIVMKDTLADFDVCIGKMSTILLMIVIYLTQCATILTNEKITMNCVLFFNYRYFKKCYPHKTGVNHTWHIFVQNILTTTTIMVALVVLPWRCSSYFWRRPSAESIEFVCAWLKSRPGSPCCCVG